MQKRIIFLRENAYKICLPTFINVFRNKVEIII